MPMEVYSNKRWQTFKRGKKIEYIRYVMHPFRSSEIMKVSWSVAIFSFFEERAHVNSEELENNNKPWRLTLIHRLLQLFGRWLQRWSPVYSCFGLTNFPLHSICMRVSRLWVSFSFCLNYPFIGLEVIL